MKHLRLPLAVLLSTVLVLVGSTAAWALWTSSVTRPGSATIGKMAAQLSDTRPLTTTFSSTATSVTVPVTLGNPGSLPGSTSTSVAIVRGSSSALASAVSVTAWPVATTADCTASTAAASGAVSGTWASLPSLTTRLAAGTNVVWCLRSTITSAAPPSSTAHVVLSLAVVEGSWTSAVVAGEFYLNSSPATQAPSSVTCTDNNDNYVAIAWSSDGRPDDTLYGLVIGDTVVGTPEYAPPGRTTLAPEQVPASVASSGTQTVAVRVLDGDGKPTSTTVGTTSVTLFTKNDGPAIRCGS